LSSPAKAKGTFSKILAAVDGSEPSMDAIDYALSIATSQGSGELIVVTVVRIPLSSYGLMTPESEVRHGKESEEIIEARHLLDKVRDKAANRNILLKTEVLDTQLSVEAAIIEYAEEQHVDLIVIGTRGKSGLKRLLLGSVASAIVTYAGCPVMVVK
jgi:nucleotide-binding universal stress UspA family protein